MSNKETFYKFIDYDLDKEKNVEFTSTSLTELVHIARARMSKWRALTYILRRRIKESCPGYKDWPQARQYKLYKVRTLKDGSQEFTLYARVTHLATAVFVDPNAFMEFKKNDYTQDHVIPKRSQHKAAKLKRQTVNSN